MSTAATGHGRKENFEPVSGPCSAGVRACGFWRRLAASSRSRTGTVPKPAAGTAAPHPAPAYSCKAKIIGQSGRRVRKCFRVTKGRNSGCHPASRAAGKTIAGTDFHGRNCLPRGALAGCRLRGKTLFGSAAMFARKRVEFHRNLLISNGLRMQDSIFMQKARKTAFVRFCPVLSGLRERGVCPVAGSKGENSVSPLIFENRVPFDWPGNSKKEGLHCRWPKSRLSTPF